LKRSPLLLLGVASACVAADQWTKHWATSRLAFREPIHLVDDLLTLTYIRNSGIAFGMFAGQNFPFYIFSIVAAVAVVWMWSWAANLTAARQLSLALILGGAVGNLVDRMSAGEVTDFILLAWHRHEFPVFNVADVCVTAGVILFALVWTHDGKPGTEVAVPSPPASLEPAAELPAPDPAAWPAPPAEDPHGPSAGSGSAGGGSGGPLGPVAGEGPNRPLA
jgi:signal peptidase II